MLRRWREHEHSLYQNCKAPLMNGFDANGAAPKNSEKYVYKMMMEIILKYNNKISSFSVVFGPFLSLSLSHGTFAMVWLRGDSASTLYIHQCHTSGEREQNKFQLPLSRKLN